MHWHYILFLYLLSIIYKVSGEITYSTAALEDQVDHSQLPGATHLSVPFNSFSGYLTIDGLKSNSNNKKHIHYWFVESEGNPETDPLVFWTNGGPGCSGMIGFLLELGPFHFEAENKFFK